ncbi:MAG: FAD:protein FMN transferase [Deltaproteobacteria bacterium]|nr:FAD:protein FMN transferase [Deltaproteobacteria bacterium]
MRIEKKYSQFLPGSDLSAINSRPEQWISVDEETEALLDICDQYWRQSEGMIDATVGVFLNAWKFDGKSPPPDRREIDLLRPFVGWEKIKRRPNQIFLPRGMQLDLGGIVKEYAVDLIADFLASMLSEGGIMVNFGGDIRIIRPKSDQSPWRIALEMSEPTNNEARVFTLRQGGIATSGNYKRYAVAREGRRLGHILNPKTGWPVPNGPSSVTVISMNAMQSGFLSTLAMLKGEQAQVFLDQQGLTYYCQLPGPYINPVADHREKDDLSLEK